MTDSSSTSSTELSENKSEEEMVVAMAMKVSFVSS